MKYYAIKHKPTGYYMPEIYAKRGYTHTEPLAPSRSTPRLFMSRAGAARALGNWLKGITSVTRTRGDGWEIDDDETWHTEHRPERKAEDMEIVAILKIES